MRVQKCKGTLTIDRRNARFRFIESAFRDSCFKWDIRKSETPTIESLHLFTSTGTLTPGTLGKGILSSIGTAGAVKESYFARRDNSGGQTLHR